MGIGIDESGTEGNGGNGSLSHAGYVTAGAGGHDGMLQILWRGRWLILLSLVAAEAGAYLYLRWTTPLYGSATRLLIEKPSQLPLQGASPGGGGTPANFVQTEAEIIRSWNVINAALQDPNVLTTRTMTSRAFPIEKVIGTLVVSVTRSTNIVNITAQSAYPDDTAQIVNAVARAYMRQCEANRRSITAAYLRNLDEQYNKALDQLRSARLRRLEFEKDNPEVIKSAQGGVVQETLARLKQELAAARMNTVKQEFYEGVKRFEFDPEGMRDYVRTFYPSGAVREDEEERTLLLEERSAIETRLQQLARGGSIEEASRQEKRAAQIQQMLEELDEAYVRNQITLANALADAERKHERQLTSMYDQESEKVKAIAGLEAEYAYIRSECDMFQDECDSRKKQIEDLESLLKLERLNIHVLEKALPAKEPSSPQVAQVVAGALAIGLMAGGGLVLLRDWRRQWVHSADEIMVMLGAPILGAVPSMAKRGFTARAQRLWLASGSAESEAYRSIRTALFFGAGQKATTILVTSPDRMEGKTTIVSNLGIAMAQAGQRTLILDADLRKPMQHRAFSFKRHEGGLTDVLLGTMTLEKAIRPTAVPGLDILTGGGGVPNPSELLSSWTFARVLGQLRGMYDRILVDSPPVAIVTDAQILATYCNLTLLVLRAQVSSRMATQRARDALLTVKAKLGGVILNDVPRRDLRNNYHGRYGSRNGHHGSNGGGQMMGVLPVEIGPLPEDTPVGPARG